MTRTQAMLERAKQFAQRAIESTDDQDVKQPVIDAIAKLDEAREQAE